jgi:hypothetical protein
MAAQNITIRKETPPERCEICHQADQFDPATQECGRCSSLPLVNPIGVKAKKYRNATVYTGIALRPSARSTLAMFLGLTAFVPGICLGPVGIALGFIGALLGKLELDKIKKNQVSHESEMFAMIGYYIGITGCITSLLLSLAYCQNIPH